MRALVIGGSGFIGLNIVDELLARGFEVRVTRRRKTPTMFLRKRAVELVEADLENTAQLSEAMRGCDVAFLAAAYYPRYSLDFEASLREGVRGVKNACDAALAASLPRLVYTSTIATLAAAGNRVADERDIPRTMPEGSVYRAVKWAMEREVDAAQRRGLDVVTLLPGGCIGPWDLRLGTGSVVVGVVRGLLPWWVDGTINLIDVRDVARAHVAAAASKGAQGRYCLGGHDVRVGWLLAYIATRYGGHMPMMQLSDSEARKRADEDEARAAPTRARVPVPRELVDIATTGQRVSLARAERELGLTLTPLSRALDDAHAWFVRFKYLPDTKGQQVTHAES